MADTTETKALGIRVDDGSRRVPITNANGDEIGVFIFRPTDLGIIDRFNEMADEFDKITEPLEKVSVKPDGTADDTDDAQVQALHEAETRLFAAIDKLFDGNAAEAFFGKMHPFSPIGGKFYVEIVLEEVRNFINGQFEAEAKRIDARVGKYLKAYKGGGRK